MTENMIVLLSVAGIVVFAITAAWWLVSNPETKIGGFFKALAEADNEFERGRFDELHRVKQLEMYEKGLIDGNPEELKIYFQFLKNGDYRGGQTYLRSLKS